MEWVLRGMASEGACWWFRRSGWMAVHNPQSDQSPGGLSSANCSSPKGQRDAPSDTHIFAGYAPVSHPRLHGTCVVLWAAVSCLQSPRPIAAVCEPRQRRRWEPFDRLHAGAYLASCLLRGRCNRCRCCCDSYDAGAGCFDDVAP